MKVSGSLYMHSTYSCTDNEYTCCTQVYAHSTVQIAVRGAQLTAVRDTFDITPSPPPAISTATGGGVSDGDLVLIVAGGGAGVAVCLSLLIVCVACCVVCHQKKRQSKKDKVKKSNKSSFSQLPRLRPTIVKVCVCICAHVCACLCNYSMYSVCERECEIMHHIM